MAGRVLRGLFRLSPGGQMSGAKGFRAALREVLKRTGMGVGARRKGEPQAGGRWPVLY